jgi:hypothetical protein
MRRSSILILGLAGLAWCSPPQVRREGAYWVETLPGSEAMLPAARLRISSRCAVKLEGGSRHVMTYALKARVTARNREDARRKLRGFSVRTARQGAYTYLIVQRGDGDADLQVKAPRTLPETIITTTEGALEVSDLDGAVRLETGGGAVKADRIGGKLMARTAGGDITLGSLESDARCITAGGKITAGVVRGAAELETGGGDIVAQEIGGLVHASTMAGSIRIRHAGSAVIASTGGGPIDVGQAHGLVTVKNSGGPVQVGSAEGVRCENAGGGVHLDNVSGSVRVTTAVGSVIARLLAGKPMADSFLSTGSGDITVFIPSNVGLTIRAQNDLSDSIRRIVSDFPGISVRVAGGQVIAEGPVNGGGPILRISGTGGTIFIKRER